MTNSQFLLMKAILVPPPKMFFNPGEDKSDKWIVSASVFMLISMQKSGGRYAGFPLSLLALFGSCLYS